MPDGNTQTKLAEVAAKIKAWQGEHADKRGEPYTDRTLTREFPSLGSDRTYGRIVAGELDELDCERWLRDYETVLNLLEVLEQAASDDDKLYDDLTTVLDLRKAVAEVMNEQGINRLVIMQGPQGSGKTTAARMLQGKYGARVVLVEATEIWKENMNAMLGDILEALGTAPLAQPVPVSAKLNKVVESLSGARRCLVIDEAHHLGLKTLGLVKTLVNRTPGEFVLLAMQTLWRRLETQAYEEARQLTQNRLLERIRLSGVEVSDVQRMLERRLGMEEGVGQAAAALAKGAGDKGNLTFVKLVCRRVRKSAGKAGKLTAEQVVKAAQDVAAKR